MRPAETFAVNPEAARLAYNSPDLPPGSTKDGGAGRIVRAALALFAYRGFHGTSIRDIAEASGMRSASLYAHFPSKEHILAELVRIGHEEHARRLRDAMLGSPPEPAEQLRRWMHAHAKTHAEYPVLTMVANGELHALPADLAAPSVALRRQHEALLVELVRRGTESGVFDPPHGWIAAAAIGGMGVRIGNWYDPALGLKPDEVADAYAELALRMVGYRPAETVHVQTEVSDDEILSRRGVR